MLNNMKTAPGRKLPSKERPPIIKYKGKKIKNVQQQSYLGIILVPQLKFNMHISSVTQKARLLFQKLRRVAGQSGILDKRTLEIIYKGAFLPIIMYCASIWINEVKKTLIQRELNKAQRTALLVITGAYRTTALSSLQVLSGQPPLDMEAQIVAAKYAIKNHQQIWFEGEFIPWHENINYVKNLLYEKSQHKWDDSETGRETYQFIKNIQARREIKHIKPSTAMTQIISGHGPFKKYLHRFNLNGSPSCECGNEQSAIHLLSFCPRWERQRFTIELKHGIQIIPESYPHVLTIPRIYKDIDDFMRKIIKYQQENV